jgi:hypothetical protein
MLDCTLETSAQVPSPEHLLNCTGSVVQVLGVLIFFPRRFLLRFKEQWSRKSLEEIKSILVFKPGKIIKAIDVGGNDTLISVIMVEL